MLIRTSDLTDRLIKTFLLGTFLTALLVNIDSLLRPLQTCLKATLDFTILQRKSQVGLQKILELTDLLWALKTGLQAALYFTGLLRSL